MLDFKPARASPPAKLVPIPAKHRAATPASSTVSRTSTLTVPELINLSPADVELLDAVIDRAGANATTFLTVFKAYNDILQERGLDPNEVVYYGKLLKLGTLKGRNWQEKWSEVKRQNGFGNKLATKATRIGKFSAPRRDDESFTLFSTENGNGVGHSEITVDLDEPHYHQIPRRFHRSPSPFTSIAPSETTEDHITRTRSYPILMAPLQLDSHPAKRNTQRRNSWRSEETTETGPSTTPPSYRAATGGKQLVELTRQSSLRPVDQPYSKIPVTNSHNRVAAARSAIEQAKQRRGSVVNEEDAWKKIEMRRDEEDADRFYHERLMERCWEVWKEGFQWIITTNDQISKARDNIILQTHFQRWRNRTSSRFELYSRVTAIANKRLLRRMLDVWKGKVKLKKQNQWRQDMRMKMKIVREKREANLKTDVWTKWRQSYKLHLADQYHTKQLLIKFYNRWKWGLDKLDHLESVAEAAIKTVDSRLLSTFWYRWERALETRMAERMIEDVVSLRVVRNALGKWKTRMHETRTADAYYDLVAMKHAIRSWKAAQARIKILDSRANKHLARQDDILLRAIMRVWKARERGKLLERVKSLRSLKKTWSTWRHAVMIQREREDVADAFSRRITSVDAKFALRKWLHVYSRHQNSQNIATQYHSSQLCLKSFRQWRSELREKLKLYRQARMIERHLITRRAWNRWREQLAEKRREKQVKKFERKLLQRFFYLWVKSAQNARNYRIAEETMASAIKLRIMSNALVRWTNRVINIKLKELEVVQHRDNAILSTAFNKWKTVCMRHVEEVNLMESYQYVKREETIRRVFYRWLAAARASRHRRLILQKKEDQMKLAIISIAWDKWRDRFKSERLRPIEHDVMLQTQRNLLFRAFGIWHAKTKSLPAIRFYASNIKAKYWKKWRAAMPRALLAKTARERHRHSVLSNYLNKWVQVYRTKMALKAVARARYLRLPTSTPRQGAASSRPGPFALPRNLLPNQTHREAIVDGSDTESVVETASISRPYPARRGIAKLLSTETRTQATTSSPSPIFLREPSPARSAVSSRGVRSARDVSPVRSRTALSEVRSMNPSRRPRPPSSVNSEQPTSRIWQELQEVRRRSRSRPPSVRG